MTARALYTRYGPFPLDDERSPELRNGLAIVTAGAVYNSIYVDVESTGVVQLGITDDDAADRRASGFGFGPGATLGDLQSKTLVLWNKAQPGRSVTIWTSPNGEFPVSNLLNVHIADDSADGLRTQATIISDPNGLILPEHLAAIRRDPNGPMANIAPVEGMINSYFPIDSEFAHDWQTLNGAPLPPELVRACYFDRLYRAKPAAIANDAHAAPEAGAAGGIVYELGNCTDGPFPVLQGDYLFRGRAQKAANITEVIMMQEPPRAKFVRSANLAQGRDFPDPFPPVNDPQPACYRHDVPQPAAGNYHHTNPRWIDAFCPTKNRTGYYGLPAYGESMGAISLAPDFRSRSSFRRWNNNAGGWDTAEAPIVHAPVTVPKPVPINFICMADSFCIDAKIFVTLRRDPNDDNDINDVAFFGAALRPMRYASSDANGYWQQGQQIHSKSVTQIYTGGQGRGGSIAFAAVFEMPDFYIPAQTRGIDLELFAAIVGETAGTPAKITWSATPHWKWQPRMAAA